MEILAQNCDLEILERFKKFEVHKKKTSGGQKSLSSKKRT